jgi:hypothetical protein
VSARPAGYSGTPLVRKLGISAGHRVATFSAPEHLRELLGELPSAVRVEDDPQVPGSADARGGRRCDVVIAFVSSNRELEARLPRAQRLLAWDGGLWIAWPKGTSPLAGDVREDDVRRVAFPLGLVDNKVCAIDQDWSGLRLVHRKENRPTRSAPKR